MELASEYILKPVSVQAVWLTRENIKPVSLWIDSHEVLTYYNRPWARDYVIFRREKGDLQGHIGDWVVKYPDGLVRLESSESFRGHFEPKWVHDADKEEHVFFPPYDN